jgi:hypothetical protein
MKAISRSRPLLSSLILWLLATMLTFLCLMYQDKTGPTYPLTGEFSTTKGVLHYEFLRSENIGTTLKIMLHDPVPATITGYAKYRRYKSNDDWSTLPFTSGQFVFTRRGRTETVNGIGAELPSLRERAGKYEYFVYVDDGARKPVSVTGDTPIYARYKAGVPTSVLIIHILAIFASLAFAIRTTLEAAIDGTYKWMLQATIVSLLLGGFVLGPLVQWYAFGVWWAGIPYGYDWTDNKVLVELAIWVWALFLNRGNRRSRWSVYVAGIVTLIVYFIPHSVFGSEYDYTTGTGHGTAG